MSVVPSTPVIITFVPAGSATSPPLTASHRSPARLTWPTLIEATDEIERDHLLPHEPPVHAPRTESSTAGRQRGAHPRSDEDDADCRHQHRGDDLRGDGLRGDTATTAPAKQPIAANSA